jgi:hypothetical protein
MGEVEHPRLYHAAGILRAAHADSDGFIVVAAPKDVVDEGDVEVELSGVFGLELAGLELNDDVAGMFDVEEKQVHVEIVPVDIKVDLPAHEGEPRAELAEGFGDPAGQGILQVASSDSPESPGNSKL